MSANQIVSPGHSGESSETGGREKHAPGEKGAEQQETRRQPDGGIPNESDCLRGIAQLTGLVALKVLSPAQANSIKGQFESILRHHRQSRQNRSSTLRNEDVLAILRESPETLSLLEPLLSDEQIRIVSQQTTEPRDAET